MRNGLITTSFGFRSTAAEVVAGIDLTGKRAIVTGASSGIGIETARALAGAGARVRSPSATPARAPGRRRTLPRRPAAMMSLWPTWR
jgi:hypothetical protein